MKRVAMIFGLIILIVFVVVSYITFTSSDKAIWFINDGGNFIPVDSVNKPHSLSIEFFKPTYWALLGVLLLLYLKILWKIISSSRRSTNSGKENKRLRRYG